jgi:hypothetical protein
LRPAQRLGHAVADPLRKRPYVYKHQFLLEFHRQGADKPLLTHVKDTKFAKGAMEADHRLVKSRIRLMLGLDQCGPAFNHCGNIGHLPVVHDISTEAVKHRGEVGEALLQTELFPLFVFTQHDR